MRKPLDQRRLPTSERLKQLLVYDPNTGLFHWRVNRRGRARAGDEAGTLVPTGYVSIEIDQKSVRAHRLAWLYVYGKMPPAGRDLDHINPDRADNRIANLRLATRPQNLHNAKLHARNKTGVTGVQWIQKHSRWRAFIQINGKQTYLGSFLTKQEAVDSRRKAEAYCAYYPERTVTMS